MRFEGVKGRDLSLKSNGRMGSNKKHKHIMMKQRGVGEGRCLEVIIVDRYSRRERKIIDEIEECLPDDKICRTQDRSRRKGWV